MSDSQKSTFFWPMILLSSGKRKAMITLYRYCRELDDIADSTLSIKEKKITLQKWEQNLKNATIPIPDFNQIIKNFKLPAEELKIIIDGMRLDLEQKIITPDLKTLYIYCRHVAGSVGVLATHIFGLVNEKTKKLALLLGETLQITNILRDIQEDQKRNRLYIPETILKKYMDINQPISDLTKNPNIYLAWCDLANLVQEKFLEVQALLKELNSQKLWPAHAMMLLYHALFLKLCKTYQQNKNMPSSPPKLSNTQKLLITLRCIAHYPPTIKPIKI